MNSWHDLPEETRALYNAAVYALFAVCGVQSETPRDLSVAGYETISRADEKLRAAIHPFLVAWGLASAEYDTFADFIESEGLEMPEDRPDYDADDSDSISAKLRKYHEQLSNTLAVSDVDVDAQRALLRDLAMLTAQIELALGH